MSEKKLPEDELDLQTTIEMESFSKSDTRPLEPLQERTTARHEVPAELLQRAGPTEELVAVSEIKFEAVMNEAGEIVVPEEFRAILEARSLHIRIEPK